MRNVIILGAGFAGVGTALELSRHLPAQGDISVTLIDKNACHTFTPGLYEVATAYDPNMRTNMAQEKKVLEEVLCIPLDEIFYHKRIKILRSGVRTVDIGSRTIELANGTVLPFDVCVFALGLETSFFHVEGADRFTLPIKTIADALTIRMRLQQLMNEGSHGDRHIVVVGGGFTGVETVAELCSCVKKLCKDCMLPARAMKLTLIEGQQTILSGSEPALIKKAQERLESLDVVLRTGTRTTKVTQKSVILDSGEELPADLVIWSTGVEAGEPLRNLQGLEKDAKGRIMANEFLQAKGCDDIFAIGDNASFLDPKTQKPAPGTAYVAEEQARVAAYNILQHLSEKPMRPYFVSQPIFVTTIGGKYAGTQIFGKTFAGFLPWVLRQIIDARYFLSILPFGKALGVIMRSEEVFTKND